MSGDWRLVVTEPLDGATNMAIDEALLRSRLRGVGRPTVRFYGWNPATVSVGYGQSLAGAVDLDACHRLGLGLVRRPTGGSAILHGPTTLELTYTVVARADDFPGADDVLETYRVLGEGLRRGLERLGAEVELVPLARARGERTPSPTFCFARAGAYELAHRGRKLVGSAQRRQGRAFLQHGAVLLDADVERLRAVFPGPDPAAGIATLAGVLGRTPVFDEVATALASGLADVLAHPLVPGGLEADETVEIERLAVEKYRLDEWTLVAAGASRLPAAEGARRDRRRA